MTAVSVHCHFSTALVSYSCFDKINTNNMIIIWVEMFMVKNCAFKPTAAMLLSLSHEQIYDKMRENYHLSQLFQP